MAEKYCILLRFSLEELVRKHLSMDMCSMNLRRGIDDHENTSGVGEGVLVAK
jgi:hypothetical protein